MDTTYYCPACNSAFVHMLGTLNDVTIFSCRSCGAGFQHLNKPSSVLEDITSAPILVETQDTETITDLLNKNARLQQEKDTLSEILVATSQYAAEQKAEATHLREALRSLLESDSHKHPPSCNCHSCYAWGLFHQEKK